MENSWSIKWCFEEALLARQKATLDPHTEIFFIHTFGGYSPESV